MFLFFHYLYYVPYRVFLFLATAATPLLFQLMFIFMFNACLLVDCFLLFLRSLNLHPIRFTSSRNLFYGLWFTQCSCDYICLPLYEWNFCLVFCTFIASPPRIDNTRLTRICSKQRDTNTHSHAPITYKNKITICE